MTAGDVPISICSSHPDRKKAPSLKRRKQIWQQCLKIAAQLSKVADGVSATRRGNRGIRVGEAAHPGPGGDRRLLMWSVNVRSWYANGPRHLDEATEKGVDVVFFQETNLTENACPSVSQAWAIKDWQILLCPTYNKTSNRGGVAIAVRKPFALSLRSQSRSPEGQTISAVLHGGQHSFSVVVHYRHPSAKDLSGVTSTMNHLEASRDKSWIVAMDSNTNLTTGPSKARAQKKKHLTTEAGAGAGKRSQRQFSKKSAGTSATGRGLRAQRVGEAGHPGPSRNETLRIMCYNVSSIHRHFHELLAAADRNKAHLICVQETRLTAASIPTFANNCQRKGWHCLAAPINRGAQATNQACGGVAILSREPLTLTSAFSTSKNWGEILVCELWGASIPLTLISGYRRPTCPPEAASEFLLEALLPIKHRHWVMSLDFNIPPDGLPLSDVLDEVNGRFIGGTGHKNSSQTIDTVWSSSGLVARKGKDLPLISDHYGSLVELEQVLVTNNPPNWMFRPHAPMVQQDDCHASVSDAVDPQVLWNSVATSQEAWNTMVQTGSSNGIWDQWSKDAESFLLAKGSIESGTHFQPRGTCPRLFSAAKTLASGQSLRERQLRRQLRRIQEIQEIFRRGRQPEPQLLFRAKIGCRNLQLPQPRKPADWGQVGKQVQDLLHMFLDQKQQESISRWKQKVATVTGACAWVRRRPPAPSLLKHGEVVTTGRSAGAALLKDVWTPIFNGNNYIPDPDAFIQEYDPWLPRFDQISLDPISLDELWKTLRKMKNTSAGTDGWSAALLSQLPAEALTRLITFFHKVELESKWPRSFYHWRLVFLPKDSAAKSGTQAEKTRPIAVGSLLYRCWSKLRFKSCSAKLENVLADFQVGGLRGHDSQTLLLAFQQHLVNHNFPLGASLDFSKCFDSVDWILVHSLLSRIGLPPAVTGPLKDMWQNQERWFTFGGQVHPETLSKCHAILQGDPFGPLALAVTLAGPLRRIKERCGAQSLTICYMDDRSMTCANIDTLRQWLAEWRRFEDFTRLKSNHEKTQVWGRNDQAKRELQEAGLAPASHMKVLGTILGASRRGPTEDETNRLLQPGAVCRRIALMPCAQKHKRLVAHLMATPKAAWGLLLTGRAPNQAEIKTFSQAFNKATKDNGYPGGRASVELRKAFFLCHGCDLGLVAAQSMLRAAAKWHTLSESRVSWTHDQIRALCSVFSPLGWRVHADGVEGPNDHRWSFSSPPDHLGASLHKLRTSWRMACMRRWRAAKRIDAQLARNQDLMLSEEVLDKVRSIASCANSH